MSVGEILRNDPNAIGQTLVASVENGGSYDWCAFMVFRDNATGVLRWYGSAGCSCNVPLDDVTSLDDMCSGDERECVTDLHAFAEEYNYHGAFMREYIAAMQSDWFKEINAIAEKRTR